MNNEQPIVIFSAYHKDNSLRENIRNHTDACHYLKYKGVPFSTGRGYYKGNAEECIMVVLNSLTAQTVVRYLATINNQESVLHVDGARLARLETSDGELIETLGKLVQVSAAIAIREDSYTVINGGHWITRPDSNAVEISTEPEPGAASILIDLSDSKITVYHGEDSSILAEKKHAVAGDWDKLWNTLVSVGIKRKYS